MEIFLYRHMKILGNEQHKILIMFLECLLNSITGMVTGIFTHIMRENSFQEHIIPYKQV